MPTMTAVIVLGMHRSGTSCLAGSLQAAGLELGTVHTANPYNKKGNRENQAIMDLHESLLAHSEASWDAPAVVTWDDEHRAARDAIIASYRDAPIWGFKDPRTCFTLEGWLEALPEARLVGTFRNPRSVADSLVHRNRGLGDHEAWYAVWEAYNRQLLHYHRNHRFPIVDFDQPGDRYLRSLDKVYQQLRLRPGLDSLDLQGVSADSPPDTGVFFDPRLRNNVTTEVVGLPESTLRLYRDLQAASIH